MADTTQQSSTDRDTLLSVGTIQDIISGKRKNPFTFSAPGSMTSQPNSGGENTGSSQSGSGSVLPTSIPTSGGAVTPQPQQGTQAPPWQTAAGQPNRQMQKRADMGALIQNVQGLVKTAANNPHQKQIRIATNDWNRLLTAMQNPNDPNNQKIIQDVLSDPKKLKQMSKALDIDWLNPAKGSDNIYRQALNQSVAQVKNKQDAIEKLKGLLTGQSQATNSADQTIQNDPAKKAQLAQEMQARFPTQAPDSKQLSNQIDSQILSKALSQGLDSLTPLEQEKIGVGASANAQLQASVRLQTAQMEQQAKEHAEDIKSTEFNTQLADRQAARAQQATEFSQTQQRLNQSAQANLAMKAQQLKQQLAIAGSNQELRKSIATAQIELGSQAHDLQSIQNSIKDTDTQIQILTNKEKALAAQYKTTDKSLFGLGGTSVGVSDEGQQKISDVEDEISTAQATKTKLLSDQAAIIDKLNSTNISSTTTNDNGNPY